MADENIIDQYILEEMKVARGRIDSEIDVMNRYEVLSIALVGAILAVIFQYKISDRIPLFIITMVPALVGTYGFYRYRSHAQIVNKYNDYLLSIEARLKSKDGSFIGLVTAYKGSKRRSKIRSLRTWFWRAIIIFSLLLTVILQFDPKIISSSTLAIVK